MAVRFEYSEVDLSNISAPPLQIKVSQQSLKDLKDAELDAIRQSVTRFYKSVMDRLNNFAPEDGGILNQSREFKAELLDMSKRAPLERTSILQLLQDEYQSSRPTDHCAFNNVLQKIHDICTQWDKEFSALMRKFLLSDKAEKRLTSTGQFRKFFVDHSAGNMAKMEAARVRMATADQEMPVFLTGTLGLEKWYTERWPESEFECMPQLNIFEERSKQSLNNISSSPALGPSIVIRALEQDIEKSQFDIFPSAALIMPSSSSVCSSCSLGGKIALSQTAEKSPIVQAPEYQRDIFGYNNDDSADPEEIGSSLKSIMDLPRTTQSRTCRRCGITLQKAIVSVTPDDDIFFGIDMASTSPPMERKNTSSSGAPSQRSATAMSLPIQQTPSQSFTASVYLPGADNERLSLMKTIKDFWTQTTVPGATSNSVPTLLGGEYSFLNELVGVKPLDYPL